MANPRPLTLEERFWAKVDRRGDDDCWPWIGGRAGNGYGMFWNGAKVVPAHRWAYQHFVGPLPQGHDVDHGCHNRDAACVGGWSCPHRPCVNFLSHLEPATRRDNLAKGRHFDVGALQRVKTHCPQGHPYDEANTYRRGNCRHCRSCMGLPQLSG